MLGAPAQPTPGIGPPTRRLRHGAVTRTVVAASLSTVLASLPVFLLGGLAVLVRRDLGFGEVQLGLAVSAFFTVAAASAVPAGRVAGRLGSWATTALAAVLSATALVAMAVAPGYVALVAALGVAGVANALAQMGSNQALARVVPRTRQGLAFGVKQSAVPVATLVAGLALPLVALTLGWRASFIGAALLAVAIVAVIPRPARGTTRRIGATRRVAESSVRALAVVAVGAGFAAGAASALGTFLVESAVTVGLSPASAGFVLASGSALAVVGRLLAGWWADSRASGLLVVVAIMLGSGAAGMALLATGSLTALWPGAVLAFGIGWSWPGLLNFAVVRLNPEAPAAATSITQTGVFAGAASGPLLFGFLVGTTSYRAAWSAAAMSMVAAAVFMLVGRHMLVADRARRAAAAAGHAHSSLAPEHSWKRRGRI